MKNNGQEKDTRDKVLEAASRLFAEKGYRGTTITMISKQSGSNIAAVNYHFGCKENLYREAWRHAHQDSVRRVPPDGGVGPERPAEERLRGRIRSGLQRAMTDDAIALGIMRHEMADPTGLLREVIDDAIGPLRRATQGILREILGPDATEMDVAVCEICVVAPWIHIPHRRHAEMHRGLAPVFHADAFEAMADRLYAYALAGIREVRRCIHSPQETNGARMETHVSIQEGREQE